MKTMSKWLATAVAVVLATGCNYGTNAFHCDNSEQCGANGQCELSQGGLCSFPDETHCGPGGRSFGDLSGAQSGKCASGQPPEIDAGMSPPEGGGMTPDAQVCFGNTLLHICLAAAPTQSLTISNTTPINTTNSPMCVATVSGGTNFCVVAATNININATLRATGSKPLVLIASEAIMMSAAGSIDVGSHRGPPEEAGAGADPDPATICKPGTPPTGDTTSGGGAGGSFTGLGGNGGTGGGVAGGTAGPVAGAITDLRGGCPGQDGEGLATGKKGHGGGAVFLIAVQKIDLQGNIIAGGEGGSGAASGSSGGGGGGSGGMIGFDAPMITATGRIVANGGGGGEGSGTTAKGNPGDDATAITTAKGGADGTTNGGDGGNGSAGAAAGTGAVGSNGNGGGGGGGGGAGLIKAPANANLGTQVSPAATP
jgi:hypothetical protein